MEWNDNKEIIEAVAMTSLFPQELKGTLKKLSRWTTTNS